MSVHRLFSVVETIAVLLVTVHPRQAASARGWFGASIIGQADPVVAGLCSHPTIMHAGYKCQEYHVVTGDGYNISMSRFPEGRNGGGANATNKQPVLLQHGILVDGMSWMLISANQSLPYILADNGYDVWISNTRGTRFSRSHVSLDPADKEFWDWTWDDLVAHELTATTDYVFNQTGQKLHYVGHSLGTLVPLAGFSEGKQVDKLKSAALLSPIAYLSNTTKTLLGQLGAEAFGEMTHFLGTKEFNPVGPRGTMFLKGFCANPGVNCYDMITQVTAIGCGELRKFDYGTANLNMDHYGVATPPIYNLSNIPKDFPLLLSYGALDKLSNVKDVQILLDKLRNHDVDKLKVQFVKEYAHADFIMAVNANDIVYNPIMAFFRAHQ